MAKRQGIAVLLAAGLLVGACGHRYPTYRVDQEWTAPPGWRLAVTGMRCGPAAELMPADSDAGNVCLVDVTYANVGDQARPFSGTADQPGPTWRLVGYDAGGHEFHGHGTLADSTDPGRTGTTALVFEVPAGLRLRRVLIGDAMVEIG